jgi:hypothetical protein
MPEAQPAARVETAAFKQSRVRVPVRAAAPQAVNRSKEHRMDSIEGFPGLGDTDISVLGLFCERALSLGNLLLPMNLNDIASEDTLSALGGDIGRSLVVLMEEGYLHRSGYRLFAVTPKGFEAYARSNITGYSVGENAIRDAVAKVDHTDTDTVMASTGETRQMVNHVLSLLQRDRDIGGFRSEAGTYYITRVSPAFKRERAARAASI